MVIELWPQAGGFEAPKKCRDRTNLVGENRMLIDVTTHRLTFSQDDAYCLGYLSL